MRWLDRIPLLPLGIVALFFGIAPLHPEPHLVEKTRMLLSGTLSRPIDIFDLFMHGTPAVLFLLRLYREIAVKR